MIKINCVIRGLSLAFLLGTGLVSCDNQSNNNITQTKTTTSSISNEQATPNTEDTSPIDLDTVFQDQKPKIILFTMLDDADYNDFGYQSSDAITPNIDSISNDGATLTNFYAGSGICSPTRVSVLTGNTPIHYGLSRLWPDLPKSLVESSFPNEYFWAMRGISETETTLGEVMKEANYSTFHIGKWHSGSGRAEYLPSSHGFDEFKIMKTNPDQGILEYQDATGFHLTNQSYNWRPQYQADEVISFIDKNKSGHVFVNWWPLEPHTPLIIPPDFNNDCCGFDLSTNRGKLLAMMYSFDEQFGRILNYLKSNNLYDDALIIVTSDNGGLITALDPIRSISGSKGTLREGGIRVPFTASWPKAIKPVVSNAVVTTYDLLPTLADIIGYDDEYMSIDGENFKGALAGLPFNRQQPAYWQMRVESWRRSENESNSDQFALRYGCYKITSVGSPLGELKLYNICDDMYEQNNIAVSNPVKFADMTIKYYEATVKQSLVYSNPMLTESVWIEDSRLNIHQDDLSVYARFESSETNKIQTIYKRGDGVHIFIDSTATTPKLVADLRGILDTSNTPDTGVIRMEMPVTTGDDIGLVIRGYLRSESSISLYKNGVEVDKRSSSATLAAPERNQTAEDSIFAIINEPNILSKIGDDKLVLRNVHIGLSALAPSQVGR